MRGRWAAWLAVLLVGGCNTIMGVDKDYVVGDIGAATTSSSSAGGGGAGTGAGSTASSGGGTATSNGTAGGGGSASSSGTGGGGGTGAGGGAGATNVVLAANGATIDSFTSEYCEPGNLPNDCNAGYWDHTNINDGDYAQGVSAVAFRAAWASAQKSGQGTPEEFVFSFAGGMSARISSLVIQNYGEETGSGPYYSTHVIVYAEPPGGGAWAEILNVDIPENEQPQVFDLVALNGAETEAGRLRLAITAGVSNSYWDLGEFEAWGVLY